MGDSFRYSAGGIAPRSAPKSVLSSAVRIEELSIERQVIVNYLKTIAPEKQEIALIHALEVGVTEMIARRERFKH
ncbi:MAG: hypothetical protein DMG04_09670 [Acidobacteria bacterium]|nr:MAG: hypothetical protein DMG04_09670 [Acidobacteriota bacterium]